MIKNYLLTTFRSISRRKGFSILNILGLAIGVASSLLILQYVKDELSYDDFHEHAESIYRVQYDFVRGGETVFQSATAFPKVAPAMLAEYPEIENACRLYLRYGGGVVRYEDTAIKEQNVFTVDQSFFEMFSYPLIKGDRKTALREPNTAVIEEETARKYFGEEDPIGKRIRFGNEEEYQITGVISSPENSHLKFTLLLSYPTMTRIVGEGFENAWGWYDFYNYIQLKPGADPKVLQAKFPQFIEKHGGAEESKAVIFSLQHLPDIHLYSDLIQEARVNGNGKSVYFLMIIALFILVIAWVNYVNLATARAVERAKEVGVRKSIGAGRSQLVAQFMGESFVINFVAVLLALVLLNLAIPVFNSLSGKALSNSVLFEPRTWYTIGGLYLLGSFIAGLYPAMVLSSYQAARVLKGSMKNSSEGVMMRKSLVVIQFAASVFLIAGTAIVYQQVKFMESRDLGIDIDGTVVVDAPEITDQHTYESQYNTFRNAVEQHPGIVSMTAATEIPGNLIYWTNGSKRIGGDQELPNTIMYRVGIDYDFFKTFNNELLSGRYFSKEFTADSASVVLNRKAIDILGFKSPEEAVGGKVRIGRDTLTVVGVVENYHQEGLKNDFRQTAFTLRPYNHSYFALKINGNAGETLAFLKERYAELFPGNPFGYFFLDSFFNRQYKQDQQFGKVFGFFALLAIFVASLGLFGLASFTASQRTKEIGIRKVLGSSVANILMLLSKDFVRLVIIANAIAIPLVWMLMNRWLDGFAFRIEISPVVFIVSASISVAIALITVSFQSVKAAVINPVKSLRYE